MSQNTHQNNKRIAKNTLFLYFRMLVVMGVSLFTSRVVLDMLGASDYALYNAVGGVVAVLSFLNGTLSIGTSRFLTFELGKGNLPQLKSTFNTAFYAHLLLAFIVLFLMETGGLWFLYNKLVIPDGRMVAAVVVFQLSLLTTFISITQVPYTAVIMAHEDMSIYAYVSIFEASIRLLVIYLLSISNYDKLITYAILIVAVQLIVAGFYRFFCIRHYEEAHLHLRFDPKIFRKLLGFTGWNVIANLSETLKLQGVIILLNLFFQPVVVAAQAIGNQIAGQMMQFYSNFRTAIDPQIIKSYAVGNREESQRLVLRSNVYVFDMALFLALPLILLMDPILHLWLVEVPKYTVIFSQYIVIQRLIACIDGSFYISLVASGRLKSNAIACVFICFVQFIGLYLIFKFNGDVMWTQYLYLISVCLFSFIVKPVIMYREIGYPIKEIFHSLIDCAKVSALAVIMSLTLDYFLGDTFLEHVILLFGTLLSVAISAYIFLDKLAKQKVLAFIKQKLQK